MERYNEYKDSGVQWLGEIPSHWEVVPLKSIVSCNDDTWSETTAKDTLINYVEISDVSLSEGITKISQVKFADAPSRARRKTRVGDIIVSTVRTYLQAIAPIDEENITVSTGFAVLRPNTVDNRFLLYYTASSAFISDVIANSKGTSYPAINANDLVHLKTLLPPTSEQQTIAAYLDKATAKIDEAIAQQQKMIDLLNERKQIIINNAVTKGLNPDVPMKDSGVDWIGEIPEHWEFVKLKRYCKIRTGKTPSTTKEYYFENGDIKWFTPGDLNKFELVDSERKVTYRAQLEQACNMFPANTVYLVGIGGTIGKVGFCETEATCNQQINAIIPNCKKINHKYLAHLIQSTKVQILRIANFSTLPIINQDRTGSLNIVVPPISEQESIVNILENKSAPINAAIKAAEKQIFLLQERKKIIINDVVTGKVKVC